MLLVDRTDPSGLGQTYLVATGLEFTEDKFEQCGLAYAVATNKSHLGTRWQADRSIHQEFAAPGIERQVGDLEHLNVRVLNGPHLAQYPDRNACACVRNLKMETVGKKGGRVYKPATRNSQTRSHTHDRTYVLDYQARRNPS